MTDLKSPFFQDEVLAPEPRRKVDPRLAAFVQQSPFARVRPEFYFAPDDKRVPGGGGSVTPIAAPLGVADFWPDAVYIVKESGDSFLNSAREFHKLWGFKIVEFEALKFSSA